MKTITLAFTGASGLPYGMRLLECLLQSGQPVPLVYSCAAQIVAKQELDFTLPNRPQDAEQMFAERFGKFSGELKVFGIQDWYAPMASGSNPGDAMVVCPCTMGTLGKIANGLSDDLIARAADVMLKERRTPIPVPRQTPLSPLHPQLIQYPRHDKIHHILHTLRVMIEAGTGRQDDGSGVRPL